MVIRIAQVTSCWGKWPHFQGHMMTYGGHDIDNFEYPTKGPGLGLVGPGLGLGLVGYGLV